MSKSVFMGMVIGALAISLVASAVLTIEASTDKNEFGKAASKNAKDKSFEEGSMGDHSKAGGAAGDPPFDDDDKPGRTGIGNVRDALGLDHVSEIPGKLCELDPDNKACD